MVQHWANAAPQTKASRGWESRRKGPPCSVEHKRQEPSVLHGVKSALQEETMQARASTSKGPPCSVEHKRPQPLVQHGVKSALYEETTRTQASTREGQSRLVDKTRPLLVQYRTSSPPHKVVIYAQIGKRRGLYRLIKRDTGASTVQHRTHTAQQAGASHNRLSLRRSPPCLVELGLRRPLVKSKANATHCEGSPGASLSAQNKAPCSEGRRQATK